ncbi:MAG: sulfotransferase [Myxococcota bacterium]
MQGDPDFAPFLIVGFPRSGTTLLQVMLDRHSELCLPPETYLFHCLPRLWKHGRTRVRAHYVDRVLGFDFMPRLGLDAGDVRDRAEAFPAGWPGAMRASLESYAAARGKRRVGEKTATHLVELPHVLAAFPQATILWLVRDGRDVAVALRGRKAFHDDLARHALNWARAIRMGLELERRYAASVHRVRFEDLIRAPEATLTRVDDALGVGFEPAQLELSRGTDAVPAKERDLKSAALGPLDPSKIGTHRTLASPAEQATMEAIMGPELAALGYPLAGTSGALPAWLRVPGSLALAKQWRPYEAGRWWLARARQGTAALRRSPRA